MMKCNVIAASFDIKETAPGVLSPWGNLTMVGEIEWCGAQIDLLFTYFCGYEFAQSLKAIIESASARKMAIACTVIDPRFASESGPQLDKATKKPVLNPKTGKPVWRTNHTLVSGKITDVHETVRGSSVDLTELSAFVANNHVAAAPATAPVITPPTILPPIAAVATGLPV